MLSNLVAVLWSVYMVRGWTRPGVVDHRLAYVCGKLAPYLGLTKKTYLCSCTSTHSNVPVSPTSDVDANHTINQNGDKPGSGQQYKECSTTDEEKTDDVTEMNYKACHWHLVLDVLDRILLFAFCFVMVAAIMVLFIIMPYAYGKIFA